VEEVELFL